MRQNIWNKYLLGPLFCFLYILPYGSQTKTFHIRINWLLIFQNLSRIIILGWNILFLFQIIKYFFQSLRFLEKVWKLSLQRNQQQRSYMALNQENWTRDERFVYNMYCTKHQVSFYLGSIKLSWKRSNLQKILSH